ncbi:MAG: superoxide dismutase [Chloroflexota bacterium]
MANVSRRNFFYAAGVATVSFLGLRRLRIALHNDADTIITDDMAASTDGPFILPDLPYAYNALEPHISADVLRFHHDVLHRRYTSRLNTLVSGTNLGDLSAVELISNLERIPEERRTQIQNQGGGYVNHALFWQMLSPDGGGEPTDALAQKISDTFGSFEDFRLAFSQAALNTFGSGWAWLEVDPDGTMRVTTTRDQNSPYMAGSFPLLGLDMWEHAYLTQYGALRGAYIDAFWNVVNWDFVAEKYDEALA